MKLAMESAGQGRDLVLLHGWGMNRRIWDPLVEALQDRFRVHRVDLPGHGESPWDASMATLERWSRAVLEVAPDGAVWVGWSLGGLVMLQAASREPHRLRALVGIAATPCFVRRRDWRTAMQPGLLEQFSEQLAQDREATLGRFLALQFQGVEEGRSLSRKTRERLAALPAPQPEALATGLELLRKSDLRAVLGELELPLLWLLGEQDRLVPPVLADALSRLAPGVTIRRISGAGHAPFLSHPQQVAGSIRRFLEHE